MSSSKKIARPPPPLPFSSILIFSNGGFAAVVYKTPQVAASPPPNTPLDELIYGRSLTEVQKLRFGKVLMTDPTRELIPTNSYYTESAAKTVPCKEEFLYTCTMNPCRRIHIYFAKWFGVLSKVCEHFRKSPCSLNPHQLPSGVLCFISLIDLLSCVWHTDV